MSHSSSSRAGSRRSMRGSMRASMSDDLAGQLASVQASYKALRDAAESEGQTLELSAHPGLAPRRGGKNAATAGSAAGSAAANGGSTSGGGVVSRRPTPGEAYDAKRRTLGALTLDLIMTLRMEQLTRLRAAFDAHGGVVNIAQFVAIMSSHLDTARLQTSPDLLMRSLVELFESMDLDGDAELSMEELLTTVVHMGLAATEHLLLTPISPYRPGPHYLVSMQQHERILSFLPGRDALLVVDPSPFALRMYDPAMRVSLAVDLPLSSALSVAYVSGLRVDLSQNQSSYKRSASAGRSNFYGSSGSTASRAGSAHARGAGGSRLGVGGSADPSAGGSQKGRESEEEYAPLWDRLSGMPLSKPMRMEGGQLAPGQIDPSTRANTQLLSELTAKPYYGSNTGLHAFTETSSSSAASGSGSSSSSSASSSSSSSRTPLVFVHEDYLITATSQYLQLWSGFPTGPARLCDQRKIRASFSAIKWCANLQRLFCGDVTGRIEVWRIILLPPSGSGPAPLPTLQRERELAGFHSDIITGLESISSMGFLLSCSLDASVRMFDLSSGAEKNRFVGHRAGVVAIAYSNDYRFLLSAGSDHRVCVWSPFATKQVYTLRGHEAPLIGVQFVRGTPQIVTADAAGWMRIWDARNFACCQVFFTMPQLTSFTACSQRHKRIFVVGRCHELRIYEQEGGPFLKRRREEPLIGALYSSFTMTLLTSTRDDIKIYDALTGHLSRVYRGLAESELSAVCMDARQRKLFVADQQGKIRCYNYVTGAYMKSLTPHDEEIIALAYSGARRLLVSATDRTVYVHDERPIEEQVLFMTCNSAVGTEYLVVSVSEQLSSLACALSNGAIELWNLDQAMRDVPVQGRHLDVITALSWVETHQLLLSADDSGTIMATFVRPSRWRGQIAFELHTPPMKKEDGSTASSSSPPSRADDSTNEDPIRQLRGLAAIPGISCMSFHAASNSLFCGHRNGHVSVWNLRPLLDFVARVSADPSATWFVTPAATAGQSHGLASVAPSAAPSNVPSPLVQPRSMAQLLSKRRGDTPSGSIGDGVALSIPLLPPSASSSSFEPDSRLPIKEQLAQLANATTPARSFVAHEGPLHSLVVIADPPALLTTSGHEEHIATVWSLDGQLLGRLDPEVGLARGYAASAGLAYTPPASAPAWKFQVDVAARERKDRATTHAVLRDLECLALQVASGANSAVTSAREGGGQTPNRMLRQGSTTALSRQASATALQIQLASPPTSPAPHNSASSNGSTGSSAALRLPSITPKHGLAPPAASLSASRLGSAHAHSSSSTPLHSSARGEEKELSASASSPSLLSPPPPATPSNAAFFLSTPISPVQSYSTVTRGMLSPGSRENGSTLPSPSSSKASSAASSKRGSAIHTAASASASASRPVTRGFE